MSIRFLTHKNTDFREFDISEGIIDIITDKPYTIVYWEKGNKVDGTWIKSSLLDNSGEELGSIVFADDNLNISDVELLKQDLFEKHNTNFAPFFDDENFPFYRHEALHITHVASELISEQIENHWYHKSNINPKFNQLIEEALSKLSQAYQYCDEEYDGISKK
jgi:hypothetical protein